MARPQRGGARTLLNVGQHVTSRLPLLFAGTLALLLPLLRAARALDNGLGLTPAMGWNSWNHFHCT